VLVQVEPKADLLGNALLEICYFCHSISFPFLRGKLTS